MIRRAGFECPEAEKGGGKEMDSLSHQLGKLGLTSHLKRRGIKEMDLRPTQKTQ